MSAESDPGPTGEHVPYYFRISLFGTSVLKDALQPIPPENAKGPEYYTFDETARTLNIGRNQVGYLMKSGVFETVSVEGFVLPTRSSVNEFTVFSQQFRPKGS